VARGGKKTSVGRPKRKAAAGSSTAPAPTPGRKPRAAPAGSLSPVDIIIGMMRGDLPFDDARFKAAVAAAPYVHARRGTAEPTEEPGVRHEDALKELE
jgi:cytochrome c556